MKLDREGGPPEVGMTGLTVWAGMFVAAPLKSDDVV